MLTSPNPLPVPDDLFVREKASLLVQFNVPDETYTDLSPKGSVDAPIRPLLERINAFEGFVTMSSCSGRVSVFMEGRKKRDLKKKKLEPGYSGEDNLTGQMMPPPENPPPPPHQDRTGELATIKPPAQTPGGVGGKGGGGTWLYVDHDTPEPSTLMGKLVELVDGWKDVPVGHSFDAVSYIHFKYEPFILHVRTASATHAQIVIRAAMEAGFRETGAVSIAPPPNDASPAHPIVAVRSSGMAFESLLGFVDSAGTKNLLCSPAALQAMVDTAVERDAENESRRARFEAALLRIMRGYDREAAADSGWEDPVVRRERKRMEGLRVRESLKQSGRRDATITTTAPAPIMPDDGDCNLSDLP